MTRLQLHTAPCIAACATLWGCAGALRADHELDSGTSLDAHVADAAPASERDAAERDAAERDAAERDAAERDAAERDERDAAERDAAERDASMIDRSPIPDAGPPTRTCPSLLSSTDPACTTATAACGAQLDFDGCTVRILRTHDLASRHQGVTRAVVALHGLGLTPESSFQRIVTDADNLGVTAETAIVGVHFRNGSGAGAAIEWPDTYGYTQGLDGVCNGDPSVSSFTVLDTLFEQLRCSLPDLENVVVAGFSVGSQTVARYMAMSAITEALPGIHMRFVVGAPSSMFYVDAQRWVDGAWRTNGSLFDECPTFNDYMFGVEGAQDVPYIGGLEVEVMRQRLIDRDIALFAGHDDRGISGNAGCEAKLQAPSRVEQAQRFGEYLEHISAGTSHHTFGTATRIDHVPSAIGHDAVPLWGSDEAYPLLFDRPRP